MLSGLNEYEHKAELIKAPNNTTTFVLLQVAGIYINIYVYVSKYL